LIPKNNERTIIAQGVGRQCKDAVRHTTFLKELDPLLELAEGQELFYMLQMFPERIPSGCPFLFSYRASAGKTAGAFFISGGMSMYKCQGLRGGAPHKMPLCVA